MKLFKKITSLVICLSIAIGTISCLGIAANAADNAIGDTNSDGSVNSFDALMIIRYCTDNEKLTDAELKAADVDGNGVVNSTDALYILHFTIGTISIFPTSGTGDRISIGGGFWYDPATGKIVNDSGAGLLGFAYDTSENVFYSTNNAWQRNFGYTYLYDVAAPVAICLYDTSRIFFDYDGKEWMVQLWKGQYGFVLVGCEIGLYYRNADDESMIDSKGRKFYKCADDEMLTKMSLSLYKDGKLLFSRKEQYSWWLTGFTPNALTNFGYSAEATQALTLDATIVFSDEDMLEAFTEALDGTTVIEHNATKKTRDYTFKYGSTYTVNKINNAIWFRWH